MAVLRTNLGRDMVRFAALSGGCWCLDLSVLLALTHVAGWPIAPANVASSLVAAAVVYRCAHGRIHSGRQEGRLARLAFYLAYTGAVIMLASAAMAGLSIVTPPQLLCNFFVSRAVARASWFRRPA
jgi:putative flippase GtrA